MAYTRISFRQFAGDGERFSPGAFDHAVGKEVTVNGNFPSVKGILIEVEVSEDGSSAWMSVDVPKGSISFANQIWPAPS